MLINLKAAITSSLVWDAPCANADFTTELPTPQYFYAITNRTIQKNLDNFQFQAAIKYWTNMGKLSGFFVYSGSLSVFSWKRKLEWVSTWL